ncbi:MAG: protein kinase [Acidobacteriota bacterium]
MAPTQAITGPLEPIVTATPIAPTFGPRIQADEVLAKRFRVVRFRGSGGLGEGYQADDLVLGESVALKVMRAEGTSELDRRRLRREVQLARRVTHRNICRIFDLIQHDDEATGLALDLVSMELIDGGNLTDEIALGPMDVSVALPIVRQIARGLNAAHSLGIVHRDLKPGNIMLATETDGLRVAITDFGVARQIGAASGRETALTQEGRLIGTPAYMAPEQLAGEATSPATDIFSLGILLYEMLSGKLPFSGESVWQVAIQRLTHPPTPLETHLPTLDDEILGLVERCLQRDPARRFQSAPELLERLDRGDSGWNVYGLKLTELPLDEIADGDPPIDRSAVADTVPSREGGADGVDSAERPPEQRTVEVDADSIGRAASSPSPRSRRRSLAWGVAVASLAGAVSLAGWLRAGFDEGRPGAEASPIEPLTSLSVPLAELPPLDPPSADRPGTVSVPEGREAALVRAAALLADYDGHAAREVLATALSEAPDDPMLRARLAEALWWIGREREAREMVDDLVIDPESSRRDRLHLEALRHVSRGEWNAAHGRFEALWWMTSEVDFAVWVFEAAHQSGRVAPNPAELLRAVRQLPGASGRDPRIDLWESRFALDSGDPDSSERLARRAISTAEGQGKTYVVAAGLERLFEAVVWKGASVAADHVFFEWARFVEPLDDPFLRATVLREKAKRSQTVGQDDEAKLHLDRALDRLEALGSDRGLCRAKLRFAFFDQVDPAVQIARLTEAVDHCAAAGARGGQAWALHHLARARRDLGQHLEAVELFRESKDILEALDDQRGIAQGRIGLAGLLHRAGRIEESLDQIEAALPWFRDGGNPKRLVMNLLVAADTAIPAGRFDDAEAWIDEAERSAPSGRRLIDVYTLRSALAASRGDSEALRANVRSIRDLNRALRIAAADQVADGFEARLAVLEGRLDDALTLLDRHGTTSRFGARLAWLHWRLGDRAAATRSAAAFAEWAEASADRRLVWEGEMVSAQMAASDAPQAAVDRLGAVEQQARELGHVEIALEAALAGARVTADRDALSGVAEAARAVGFERLAQQAEASVASVVRR